MVTKKTDHCQTIPVEVYMQDKIWVDADKNWWTIATIPDGHLDNLIKWITQHAAHYGQRKRNGIVNGPLMGALMAEQQRRIPHRNKTPEAALKDTLLNDLVLSHSLDKQIQVLIKGLEQRGYGIKKL